MPEVKLTDANLSLSVLHAVEIIESERGWGQKIDCVKYFDCKKDALQFCADYNAANTSATAPDWYMQANYVGEKQLVSLIPPPAPAPKSEPAPAKVSSLIHVQTDSPLTAADARFITEECTKEKRLRALPEIIKYTDQRIREAATNSMSRLPIAFMHPPVGRGVSLRVEDGVLIKSLVEHYETRGFLVILSSVGVYELTW